MKGSIDYGWVIALAAIIALAIFWKPVSGLVRNFMGGTAGAKAVERGKLVFYDAQRWEGEKSYKSCAMCHAADFVIEPGKKIEMEDYKEGAPVSLKGVSQKKRAQGIGTDDELLNAIDKCITHPTRIRTGSYNPEVPFMKDLITYVRSL